MQTAQTSSQARTKFTSFRPTVTRARAFATVDEILRAVVERVEPRAEALLVQLFVKAGTGGFEGDVDDLVEALSSIVLNAIEATPRGGAVIVATQELRDGSQAWGVRDFVSGRQRQLAHLRARQVFEAHGGEMLIRSKGDAGTLVSVHLPRGVDEGLHAAGF